MKKSKTWTVCYAIKSLSNEEPYTASWFAIGRTKEEAAAAFLRQEEDPDDIVIINVVPGFSA